MACLSCHVYKLWKKKTKCHAVYSASFSTTVCVYDENKQMKAHSTMYVDCRKKTSPTVSTDSFHTWLKHYLGTINGLIFFKMEPCPTNRGQGMAN